MTGRSEQISKLEDVKRCFNAYGADIAKWPADKREAYRALAMSDEMASIRREAAALDALLDDASAPQMSADLTNRIAAQYEPPARPLTLEGFVSKLFSHGQFLPAGAAAGLAALGLALGVVTANTQASLTPEAELYAYLEEGSAMTVLDDAGGVTWDED